MADNQAASRPACRFPTAAQLVSGSNDDLCMTILEAIEGRGLTTLTPGMVLLARLWLSGPPTPPTAPTQPQTTMEEMGEFSPIPPLFVELNTSSSFTRPHPAWIVPSATGRGGR